MEKRDGQGKERKEAKLNVTKSHGAEVGVVRERGRFGKYRR